ncbi:TRASH domain-containing protein [Thermoplasma sp.]|uniref:TRASH domain-containing protein n=1 Tax=Thermoplasma sp. TaxID=1973142 RepID=UPI0012875C81|nr:TRASH domain-containing protein [Thermoplasma sp.]KAA8922866.1 MAG: TRASH domain-containing protein [Thermoplasma sp.]
MSIPNLSKRELIVLGALYNNSRLTIEEISSETGIGRNTVAQIIRKLENNGTIKGYTIRMDDSDMETVIAVVNGQTDIPEHVIYEDYALSNGRHMLVLDRSALSMKFPYEYLWISTGRSYGKAMEARTASVCDYCGKTIVSDPIIVHSHNRDYYVCCPNCEHDLKKRLKTDS